ncbi:MAG TPA: isochorismatase family cysteine hydrolase, partial [Jatrophihabitantaceae bacterium]|nr:isochorismatase family cysteine hydrolase [Jatrophihabitantaceae bacterium]
MADYTQPHWDRSALVVIDFQRDFLDDGVAAVPGTTAVVPKVASLVEGFRSAGRPIIHVIRLYQPRGSDIDPPRRDSIEKGTVIVAPGTEGSQVADGVLPNVFRLDTGLLLAGRPQEVGPNEVVIFKPRWSAFHRTELEALLREQG